MPSRTGFVIGTILSFPPIGHRIRTWNSHLIDMGRFSRTCSSWVPLAANDGTVRHRFVEGDVGAGPRQGAAAIASTSTRNSGRVNPATIISVEQGFGSTFANARSRTAMYSAMCSRLVT